MGLRGVEDGRACLPWAGRVLPSLTQLCFGADVPRHILMYSRNTVTKTKDTQGAGNPPPHTPRSYDPGRKDQSQFLWKAFPMTQTLGFGDATVKKTKLVPELELALGRSSNGTPVRPTLCTHALLHPSRAHRKSCYMIWFLPSQNQHRKEKTVCYVFYKGFNYRA